MSGCFFSETRCTIQHGNMESWETCTGQVCEADCLRLWRFYKKVAYNRFYKRWFLHLSAKYVVVVFGDHVVRPAEVVRAIRGVARWLMGGNGVLVVVFDWDESYWQIGTEATRSLLMDKMPPRTSMKTKMTTVSHHWRCCAFFITLSVQIINHGPEHVSGAENGAERAENRVDQ